MASLINTSHLSTQNYHFMLYFQGVVLSNSSHTCNSKRFPATYLSICHTDPVQVSTNNMLTFVSTPPHSAVEKVKMKRCLEACVGLSFVPVVTGRDRKAQELRDDKYGHTLYHGTPVVSVTPRCCSRRIHSRFRTRLHGIHRNRTCQSRVVKARKHNVVVGTLEIHRT